MRANCRHLPYTARRRSNHRRIGLARKRFPELRHVRERSVDPVFVRRMGIGRGLQPFSLGPGILAPDLAPPEEDPLFGGEAVHLVVVARAWSSEVRHQRQTQAAVVGRGVGVCLARGGFLPPSPSYPRLSFFPRGPPRGAGAPPLFFPRLSLARPGGGGVPPPLFRVPDSIHDRLELDHRGLLGFTTH